MSRRENDPLLKWKADNNPDRRTQTQIWRWLDAAVAPEKSLKIEEDFENWLRVPSQRQAPDLVACAAWYGFARILLQDFNIPPIDILESENQRWRDAGYHPTIEDFEVRLASVAGGFLEIGGRSPKLFVTVIDRQVAIKVVELERLVNLPLGDSYVGSGGYTPIDFAANMRAELVARGVSPENLEHALTEALEDGEDSVEQDMFDRPFVLREQLECFAWALEKLRMFAISEHEPKLGLPNPELHEALMQIDLNDLYRHLQAIDPKLRRIWHHLAKHNYYELNREAAPDRFWWRHWKTSNRT